MCLGPTGYAGRRVQSGRSSCIRSRSRSFQTRPISLLFGTRFTRALHPHHLVRQLYHCTLPAHFRQRDGYVLDDWTRFLPVERNRVHVCNKRETTCKADSTSMRFIMCMSLSIRADRIQTSGSYQSTLDFRASNKHHKYSTTKCIEWCKTRSGQLPQQAI